MSDFYWLIFLIIDKVMHSIVLFFCQDVTYIINQRKILHPLIEIFTLKKTDNFDFKHSDNLIGFVLIVFSFLGFIFGNLLCFIHTYNFFKDFTFFFIISYST